MSKTQLWKSSQSCPIIWPFGIFKWRGEIKVRTGKTEIVHRIVGANEVHGQVTNQENQNGVVRLEAVSGLWYLLHACYWFLGVTSSDLEYLENQGRSSDI